MDAIYWSGVFLALAGSRGLHNIAISYGMVESFIDVRGWRHE